MATAIRENQKLSRKYNLEHKTTIISVQLNLIGAYDNVWTTSVNLPILKNLKKHFIKKTI